MNIKNALPATLLLLSAFVFVTAASAQEKPERKDGQSLQQHDTKQEASQRAFVDEDGDGINDRKQAGPQQDGRTPRQQIRERRRDHFIDVDGDGINDERCDGMGVGGGERRGQQKGGRHK